MMTEKIVIRKVNLDKEIEKLQAGAIHKEDKRDILKFIKDAQLGKVTGRSVKDETMSGYLSHLRIYFEFIKKPTGKLTEKNIDRYWDALLKNEIKKAQKNKHGEVIYTRPFADGHKVKLRNTTLMYLRWKLGDKSHKITKSLRGKFTVPKKTLQFLSEDEMNKLFSECRNNKERYILAVLFDSGARRQEFYNIRKSDIEIPSDGGYIMLTLREEFSKTLGRTIPMMWKHTNKAIQEYLVERIAEGIEPEEAVLDIKKNPVKTSHSFISRILKRVLNKSGGFHLFRKSSATFYSKKFNGKRDSICYRYGWKFSSPMPDIYINRAGARDVRLIEEIKNSDIDELRVELGKYKNLGKIKDQEMNELQEQMNTLATNNRESMLQVKELLKVIKKKD